ncbi:MAG TPA: PEGA domain-containing protein [Candidatus Saccharimonadales bacterium]|nr:PEGA domain-containing protein [Candidatus Saccharimonadales bacterium]
MDFLDPKKQKLHKIQLLVGYGLIAIALVIATTILLYSAYGFGIDKNGKVIQNGLVFLSTRPSPANIYLNGTLSKSQTNTRVQLPAGQYQVKLQRDGYRTWQREVTVAGGDVQHFDYPFLFPVQLSTASIKQYATPPSLVSVSPDRHWAVVQDSGDVSQFDVFDLTKPKTAPVSITLPKNVLTATDQNESWQDMEWSNDNTHLLLQHLYQKSDKTLGEYVVLARDDPTQSFNLSKTINLASSVKVELRNKAYDQYWLYDQADNSLSTATLKSPTPTAYLNHVLNFKPYGNDMVLYATDQATTQGKVGIKLRQGDDTFALREVAPSATPYLIDLAQYSGDWYVITGSPAENKVYIYKNPVAQLQAEPKTPAAPFRVLRLNNPSYVSFSANTQYIMAESATGFGVYDAFGGHQYTYTIKSPMDAPQVHAIWMDAARLTYVSDGKQLVFDYDGTNAQSLETGLPQYEPFFDRDYKYSFSFTTVQVPASASKPASTAYQLGSTPLQTAADQK